MTTDDEGKESGGDRDARGRFLPGNPGGPGNPHAKHTADFKAAILQALTPKDMGKIVTKLVTLACDGDVPAAKELLNRVLGKGVLAVNHTHRHRPEQGEIDFEAEAERALRAAVAVLGRRRVVRIVNEVSPPPKKSAARVVEDKAA